MEGQVHQVAHHPCRTLGRYCQVGGLDRYIRFLWIPNRPPLGPGRQNIQVHWVPYHISLALERY